MHLEKSCINELFSKISVITKILSWFHLTLTCKSFVLLFLTQHTRSILGVISSTKNQFRQCSNSLKRSQSFAIED